MKNQRKDGRLQKWIIVGKNEDGKAIRKLIYANTKDELEQKAEALKKDAMLGKVGANVPTFSSISYQWLNELSKERSRSTIAGYRTYLNRFLIPVIGEKRNDEITKEDIRKTLESAEKEKYSLSSIMQIKSVAVRVAQFARINGITVVSQWDDITVGVSRKRDEQRVLTKEEVSLILSKKDGHVMCLPVLIMLFCGLKGTELRALEWSDICLEDGVVTVNKDLINCKFLPEIIDQPERVIPIPKQLFIELHKNPMGKGLLCPNSKGLPMTNGEFQTAWTSYCRFLYRKDKGYSYTLKQKEYMSRQDFFTSQSVRVTYAKMLFETNLNILEIHYMLGHTSMEATIKLAERFLTTDFERIRENIC